MDLYLTMVKVVVGEFFETRTNIGYVASAVNLSESHQLLRRYLLDYRKLDPTGEKTPGSLGLRHRQSTSLIPFVSADRPSFHRLPEASVNKQLIRKRKHEQTRKENIKEERNYPASNLNSQPPSSQHLGQNQ
ncbi:hypothetical protein K1719_035116 [Acacia pycnantha]|nr:hypothetical protein K1719_035116 [Acacia pycnantha]